MIILIGLIEKLKKISKNSLMSYETVYYFNIIQIKYALSLINYKSIQLNKEYIIIYVHKLYISYTWLYAYNLCMYTYNLHVYNMHLHICV